MASGVYDIEEADFLSLFRRQGSKKGVLPDPRFRWPGQTPIFAIFLVLRANAVEDLAVDLEGYGCYSEFEIVLVNIDTILSLTGILARVKALPETKM